MIFIFKKQDFHLLQKHFTHLNELNTSDERRTADSPT